MDYPSPDGPPPDLLRSGERGENGIDIRGHGLVLVDLFLCLLKILSFRNQSDIGAVLSVVNGRKLNDLLAGPVLILYIVGDGEQLAAVSLVRYSADENISVIGRSDIITAFPGRGELDLIIMGTGERNRLASKGGSLFTALFLRGLRFLFLCLFCRSFFLFFRRRFFYSFFRRRPPLLSQLFPPRRRRRNPSYCSRRPPGRLPVSG